jgi:hypothetical protein
VSCALSSIIYAVIAARITGQRPRDFWVPRRGDVRFAVATAGGLARRIAARSRPPAGE